MSFRDMPKVELHLHLEGAAPPAFIAGLIGAASNVGFLLVALLSMGLSQVIGGVESVLLSMGVSQDTTTSLLQNSAWRFLMISGAFYFRRMERRFADIV